MAEQVGVYSRIPKDLDGLYYSALGRSLKVGYDFEEFLEPCASTTDRLLGKYYIYISGAGALIYTLGAANDRPGLACLETGTTAAGAAVLWNGGTNANGLLFGAGEYTFETDIFIGGLSTAIEEYGIALGFGDNVTYDNVDGAYFKYDRAVTGVNWQLVTANNSARTTVNSGVIVTAGVWHRFKVVVNTAGTLVSYYIDNILVGTIATNIPTGAGRLFGPNMMIVKTVGLTTRFFYSDWIWFHYNLAVSR